MDKDHLIKILEAARLAPSADNSQPWFFAIEESSIFLFHDKENTHTNHLYNIDYFADYVSLGTVLENIHIQAHHLGYTPNITLLEGKGKPIAKVELSHTHSSYDSELLTFIPKRNTNRKSYSSRKIPKEVKSEIKAIARDKNAEIYWIDNRKAIKKLAKIISGHDVVLWEDKNMRDNLVRMLRFGKKTKHQDGLPFESLELGIKKYLFRPMMYLAGKINFLWKALSLGSVQHTRTKVIKSGALAVLVMPKEHHPHSYVEGGRIMQSIWLNATGHGISFQPMFGTLALLLNKKLTLGGLNPKHEKIQQEIHNFFSQYFPQMEGKTPVSLFRLGYAKKPSAVSGRKDLKEIIKAKK